MMREKLITLRVYKMMSIGWEFAVARRWSREHWRVHRKGPKGTVGEMVSARSKTDSGAIPKPPAPVA